MTTFNQAAKSAGDAILRALVFECKSMPDVWQKLREFDQQQRIDRLRQVVDNAVRQAVVRIASSEFASIGVTVDSMAIKDDASAKVTVPRSTEAMHELADRVGKAALLVFADPEPYLEGMELVRAEAEQPGLPLEGDDDGETVEEGGEHVTLETEGEQA